MDRLFDRIFDHTKYGSLADIRSEAVGSAKSHFDHTILDHTSTRRSDLRALEAVVLLIPLNTGL